MHPPQKTGLENPPHRARLRGIANAAGAPPRTFSDIRKMPLVLGALDSEKTIAEKSGAQDHILADQ